MTVSAKDGHARPGAFIAGLIMMGVGAIFNGIGWGAPLDTCYSGYGSYDYYTPCLGAANYALGAIGIALDAVGLGMTLGGIGGLRRHHEVLIDGQPAQQADSGIRIQPTFALANARSSFGVLLLW